MSRIEQLRIAGQLPSPKGVAMAIMEISRREEASLDEVAQVVQTDPALSGRLLQLANSAMSSGRAVASINDAVMRLGMKSVRQLAMGFSLVDQYSSSPNSDFDYQAFWSHCLLMAVASQELAKIIRVGAPDEMFACGLLARIGQLALATLYPAEYAGIIDQGLEGEELLKLERQRLESDHMEFTAAILEDCGLPKALTEPLCHHETLANAGFSEGSRPYQMTQLFFHARRIADLGLAKESDRHHKTSELIRLGGMIGLDADAFGGLFDRVVEQWRQWGQLLKIQAQEVPTFLEMAETPVPRATQGDNSSCKRVLVVDDDPTALVVITTILEEMELCEVHTACNGREALAAALELMPQIVITDWLMPEMDGLELCRSLRNTEWGQPMYVIMLTGVEAEEEITKAFEAGVDDYVTKPINPSYLMARMRAAMHYARLLEAWERDRAQLEKFAAELAISNRRLEHAAMTDLLTGIPNRRAGMDALEKAWSASKRTEHPVSVLMIDVDRFKDINDRHGHAVGDRVLQAVASAIQSAARKDDTVSRFGGEEFLLVCPNTPAKTALMAAERLRHVVKELKLNIGGAEIPVTTSIGVASRENDMGDFDALVSAADKALYSAKSGGRDRVCLNLQGKIRLLRLPEGREAP